MRVPALLVAALVAVAFTCLPASADPPTPLISAAKRGDVATIKREIARKAEVNAKDDAGMTALMWAALHGHESAASQLLAAGARPNEIEKDGGTAMDFAAIGRHPSVESLLDSKGGKYGLGAPGSSERRGNLFMWLPSRADDIFAYARSRTQAQSAAQPASTARK